MPWVIAIFLILTAIGMPIAFGLGISGAVFFLLHPEMPFRIVFQLPVTQTQNYALLAVPLFIFAGNLLNSCGITERLIELSKVLTGHMAGGLAQVSVVLSTLMGGVSGSSTADAAMEARILGPDMLRQGYSKGYTVSVIGFTSLITSTIPPGIGLIIYGTTGQVSIGRLFAAGLISGLVMMAVLMITVWLTSLYYGYKPLHQGRAPAGEIVGAAFKSIYAVIFPVLLLVGIRLGVFTPSEVGAFACVYSIFVGVAAYRELTWTAFVQALRQTIGDLGGIMFLIAMTGVFGYGIPYERVPDAVTGFVTGLTANKYVIIYIVVAFLFVAGMFIDGSACVLLFTPIFLPLIKTIGVDEVQFGLILCTICTLGIMTPPVGVAMYIVCEILKCPIGEYVEKSWPFFAAVLMVLTIYTFWPGMVLFLPDLIFG
ncbi:MAG: TRAP transporter large permease [Planctomycetota bacterium]|jgi:tripartite ATP-independent transporter DctM subunit|nr:TRAP transporter large permease [Planctomycetota bacterium]